MPQRERIRPVIEYVDNCIKETTDAALRELLEKLRSQINGEKGELSLSEEDISDIKKPNSIA